MQHYYSLMFYFGTQENERGKLRKIIAKNKKTNYNKGEMPMANEIVTILQEQLEQQKNIENMR